MDLVSFNSENKDILDCYVYNQHFVAMMNVINKARLKNVDGKFEVHHIVPRCYYKKVNAAIDNNEYNLVKLTIEEHKLVHKLAALCAKDFMKNSLQHACNCMHNLPRGLNCKIDEEHRKKISETLKKKGIKPPSRTGHTAWNKGKKLSPEYRKLVSERTKQAMQNDEIRNKCGWSKGLTKETDERIAKRANNLKGHIPWNKKEKI